MKRRWPVFALAVAVAHGVAFGSCACGSVHCNAPGGRPVMMAWEPADAYVGWTGSAGEYVGSYLRQEVTDFAVGVNAKTLAAADRDGRDLARLMINDVALAKGMRCWASVRASDVDVLEKALGRYLVEGVIVDLSAGHEDAAALPAVRRARELVDLAAKRREVDMALGLRFGDMGGKASCDAAKRLLADVRADLVLAPLRVLSSLSSADAADGPALVADDQPRLPSSDDYRAWFRSGLDAGVSGFCFPRYREFPFDKVPFLSTRRLSKCALAEYDNLDVLPKPQKMKAGKGTYAGEGKATYSSDNALPPEGYRLAIDGLGVRIASKDAAGRFYADRTLEQLARPDGSYPFVEIEDAPAFRWRGVQMDESRHFFGKPTVKKLLDTMARYKLNVFHWHLVDGDGWRLEVPGLPELTQYGAVRPAGDAFGTQMAVVDGKFRRTADLDRQTYGPFYYTEADVKEILAYAAERHIVVVPEVDFPGHFAAVLAAYPAFACDPSAAAARVPNCTNLGGEDGEDVGAAVRRRNASSVMCVGNDEAVAVLERVLDYVCRVFPSPYVNIGGDECPTTCWADCAKCKARMRANGLKDVGELQPWLTRHFLRFLEARGKRVMGYDEMLVGDVPKSAVGWYWRPERWKGRTNMPEVRTMDEWTALGYDMVNCSWDYTYFYCAQGLDEDPFMYGNNVQAGGRPHGGDALSLAKAYSFDPARGVRAENRRHVLGGACSNWAEYTWNRYDFEWKLWPRGLAFAEVLWCGRTKPGFADFLRRARVERRRLIRRGVNCAPVEEEGWRE